MEIREYSYAKRNSWREKQNSNDENLENQNTLNAIQGHLIQLTAIINVPKFSGAYSEWSV